LALDAEIAFAWFAQATVIGKNGWSRTTTVHPLVPICCDGDVFHVGQPAAGNLLTRVHA
jgi:hypothetical protein